MSTIYSTATVCLKDKPHDCQTLEPGLEAVMADSQDYGERLHVWEGWRREVGKKMRPLYEKYVDLKNEAAQLNGQGSPPGAGCHRTGCWVSQDRVLGTTGQGAGCHRTGCWVSQDRVLGVTGQGAGCHRTGCWVPQDRVLGHRTGCWVPQDRVLGAGCHRTGCWGPQDRVLGAQQDRVLGADRGSQDRILPLYEQLHAYVRSRLVEVYPDHVHPEGPLPAHLLGDMWGRFWTNLYSLSMPYPHKPDIDVSKAMVEQNWEAVRLFQEAEKFFQSVGLFKMEDDFWVKSMLTKPTDGRKVVCHPTAWDMGNGKDYSGSGRGARSQQQQQEEEEVKWRRASEVWADSSSKMLSRTVAGAALLLLLLAVGPPGLRAQESPTEIAAREFLQKFDVEASHRMYQYSLASWDYNTNITEENSKKL
ncbi:hypothetical protein CRUP_016791, partial [Coryphaenoides rupestris]